MERDGHRRRRRREWPSLGGGRLLQTRERTCSSTNYSSTDHVTSDNCSATTASDDDNRGTSHGARGSSRHDPTASGGGTPAGPARDTANWSSGQRRWNDLASARSVAVPAACRLAGF